MTSATSDDPSLARSAALRARAGAICHCSPVLLSGERGAEDISGPGGPRKSLKRLNSDKEIQGKPSLVLGFSLGWLGPAWLNLDSAWIRLGLAHCPIFYRAETKNSLGNGSSTVPSASAG